jgi:transcriptional regulator with XRE-family HTH domain
METNFADWLREKLKKENWSQAELSRRSGVSPAQITRVISGERGLGEQSILAIAQALKLPPEEVFRAAGLLPSVSAERSKINELEHLANMLGDDDLQEVIEYAKMRLRLKEDKQANKKQTSRKNPARRVLKEE